METNQISLIHGLPENSPSVRNLLQGIYNLGDMWEVNEYPIRSNLSGNNLVTKAGELIIYQFNVLRRYIELINGNTDILIIHKTFSEFIPDLLLSSSIAEKLFTQFDRVVFSTYDATYINHEKKSNFLFKNSDLIYATSKKVQKRALEVSTENQVSYIPPSVDVEFFSPQNDSYKNSETESITLGWIGNAALHKEDLIKLSENLRNLEPDDVNLRLLTGGATVDAKLQTKLNMITSNIDYIQWVPCEDVPKVINSFDVGLAPLCDTEFNRARSSEKMREYMACGVPVIASDIGENKHLLGNNCGFLVSGRNEWEDAVDKLTNKKIRRSMGESAQSHVMDNYSIPVISNRIHDTLIDLVHTEV